MSTAILRNMTAKVMITTIIFDAFGTLFKVGEGGSAKKIIHNIVENNNDVDYEAFALEWKAYYKRYTTHESEFKTERDIFISRIKMFYDRFGVNRDAEEDTDALLAAAFEREAFEEVKEVIEELRKHYKVFIGSNTDNDVLESVMDKNGIVVDKVYTSENLKCYKPNANFYKKILEENGVLPQEVLFVGDSVSDDILGPKALGIKTVLVDRSGENSVFGQDYMIDNLRKLHSILTDED